jgi:hypothetical protein
MPPSVNTSSPKEVASWNFFTRLRATDMDMDSASTEASPRKAIAPRKTGRLPPVVLTSVVNLIQLPKQLKGVERENFEFCSTRNGTRVITRGMADFQSIKSHFDNQNLSYYSFFPKSEKPIKVVICHLPHNTPAEDISDGLIDIPPYYKNGTNDGTPESHAKKMDVNLKEINEDTKTNQAKADAKLKRIRAGQELLNEEMLAKMETNQERMMAKMDSQLKKMQACLGKMEANPEEIRV